MSILIDGKATSQAKREALTQEVAAFREETGCQPALAVVMVGDNPASAVYVRNKHTACESVGMYTETLHLPEQTTEQELLALVEQLNQDARFHGILVQLPLPKHINETKVLDAISPDKDVDAFHPYNVGALVTGRERFLPCTPAGIMELLRFYGISVKGKNCVVIGRSNIVGKPMAMLLLAQDGTVSICHSKTNNLRQITQQADILVAAVGRPRFVTADMVKEGAVVIDVGINRLDDGKLCGDVDFDTVAPKAYAITPVPGGVGPMTITMLLYNTLTAAKLAVSGK
ncbi:MAG: bifunctional methylenetetrahydrofolate dehydrogenase/methenyltetrahydrofolate cyclohydrolase FolD [Clostridia bacterium]|nr:bifunctional methylenetetrahydrofolate dehydrogenase/methenyltetrahydrofolate cyclohydrolase FolD [Clostridia bacterium]